MRRHSLVMTGWVGGGEGEWFKWLQEHGVQMRVVPFPFPPPLSLHAPPHPCPLCACCPPPHTHTSLAVQAVVQAPVLAWPPPRLLLPLLGRAPLAVAGAPCSGLPPPRYGTTVPSGILPLHATDVASRCRVL